MGFVILIVSPTTLRVTIKVFWKVNILANHNPGATLPHSSDVYEGLGAIIAEEFRAGLCRIICCPFYTRLIY